MTAEELALEINDRLEEAYDYDEPELRVNKGYIISAVPPSLLSVMWKQCAPLLLKVVDVSHGEITLQSTKERLEQGRSLLLIVVKEDVVVSATVIEVREFDSGKKALYLPLMGGYEMDEWGDQMLFVAKAIGRDFGCTELRGLAARNGWIRKLKSRGWEEVSVAISCKID